MKESCTLATLLVAICLNPAFAGENGTAQDRPPLVQGPQAAEPAEVCADVLEADLAGAWLGVQLSPVPAALASHLQIEGKGVMVGNVFRDGPADKAGLQRYDVIIKAGGEEVAGSIESFAKYVRDKAPGDALELTIYRKGKETSVKVQLGERPAKPDDLEPKYEDDPDAAHQWEFGLRGKILRPGPDGWILDDLGELPGLEHLYDKSLKLHDRYLSSRNDDVDEGRRVDKEGRVLHVRRQKDGTIVVKRYQSADGEDKAEVKTYDSMEQLQKGDPEAYDLLSSARQKRYHVRPFFVDPGDERGWWRDPFHDVVPKVLPPDSDKKWQEWRERFFQLPRELPKALKHPDSFMAPDAGTPKPEAPPATRFEVRPNSEITVHLRSDDEELSMTYESAEAFKQQAPKLYERFKALKDKLQ